MRVFLLALTLVVLPSAWAAPPGRLHEVSLLGDTYYLEERDEPNIENGFEEIVFDGGLWIYRESNGIGGLQRGGVGLFGDWFPTGCNQNWFSDPLSGTVPCLIINEDTWNDENYGAGPDSIITALPWRYSEAFW